MPDGLVTHSLPGASVVCHNEGIVEPITLALFHAVVDDRRRGEYLVESALADGSPSFLLRLYIAFNMVSELVDEERQCWALGLIRDRSSRGWSRRLFIIRTNRVIAGRRIYSD